MLTGLFRPARRRRDFRAATRRTTHTIVGLEGLEPRALLNGQPVTKINFTDLSNLPAANKIYVGGWINGGQAVQTAVTQVANVVIQSGVSGGQSPAGPQLGAATLSITAHSADYVFDPVNPARLTINGTGFGSVPSANTIVFYEDAAGTILSPVNPGGAAGPFWSSIPDGTDTSLNVAFDATASGNPQPNAGPLYARISTTWASPLQADGTFATDPSPAVPFYDVASLAGGVSLDTDTNGNDRLVFVASPAPPTATSSQTPWGNYPISALPQNTATVPPGPFGFMEFGYDAQFNTSYVDSFGLNWSFVDDTAQSVVYGVRPTIDRHTMQQAYGTFTGTTGDPLGGLFHQLLWTSTTTPVPAVVDGQFTAIVSPKDWLAVTPSSPTPEFTALENYWTDTVDEFFADNNQLNISLNGQAYTGTASGGTYTLQPGNVVIAKADYAGTAIFSQPQPDNTLFGQLKDAVFEAFSRGVALDGVWKAGRPGSPPAGYSSDAWTNYPNWYKPGATTYDPTISRTYDVYAKFFHYATSDGKDFRDVAGGKPMLGLNGKGWFAMAYGFSLDESPSVNTAGGGTWPTDASVNGGTTIGKGGSITVTFGPWGGSTPSAPTVVSIDTRPPQAQPGTPTPTAPGTVTWDVLFNEAVTGVSAANFALVASAGLTDFGTIQVSPASTASAAAWTVTASTGTGTGTLRLDMVNATGITDAEGLAPTGIPLQGQAYDVERGDVPGVRIPIAFWAQPGRRTNLVWPRSLVPFTGPATRELTVTLAATGGDGSFAARQGIRGVTVAGTGTGPEISLTGTTRSLNAYFRTAGRLGYTPAGESLLPRVLSVSAVTTTDTLAGFDTAAILVRGRTSPGRPTIAPQTALGPTPPGTPLEITYDTLVAAADVPAAASRSVEFLLGRISTGRLEIWDGADWVRVKPRLPRFARSFETPLLAPGGRIRWTPPAGRNGEVPAFTVRAWDGRLKSATVSQVSIDVGTG